MRKLLVLTVVMSFFVSYSYSQRVALKTNLAYAATTTPNLGLELGLGKRSTLELGYGLNLFTFEPTNKKFKHWLFQPEYRWWFCERFNGLFLGAHLHGGQFNTCLDVPLGRLDNLNGRHQGYLYGGGLGAGYQWLISPSWSFELSAGAGYARIHYDKFQCVDCGTKLDDGIYNYWGLTKLELSFLYFIK